MYGLYFKYLSCKCSKNAPDINHEKTAYSTLSLLQN